MHLTPGLQHQLSISSAGISLVVSIPQSTAQEQQLTWHLCCQEDLKPRNSVPDSFEELWGAEGKSAAT